MERSKLSGRKSYGGKTVLVGAALATALVAPLAGSAALEGGSFFIYAYDSDEPEIDARAGLNGLSGNPGIENPGGETPDSVVFSFECDGYSFDITQRMIDWSDENKEAAASGGSVNPYPDGGWSYILTGSELDSMLPPDLLASQGLSATAYAFSTLPTAASGSVWSTSGFTTTGLHNDSGPAMVTELNDGFACNYGKAKNGLAEGDSATDPAMYTSVGGGANTYSYFASKGELISDPENPAAILNAGMVSTIWAAPGMDWNDVPRTGSLDWATLDRGERPSKIVKNTDGSIEEWFVREREGKTVYHDRYSYNSSGDLVSYTAQKGSPGPTSESPLTVSWNFEQKKPATRIDGPSGIYYNADGSIERTEYQWEGQPAESYYGPKYGGEFSQSYYEDVAGGTGWIGFYERGERDMSYNR